MAKISSIKTIENELHKELEDIMEFIDVRGDTITIQSKDNKKPISVSIMNGEQITPRHREVNLKLNFEAHDDPTYLKSYAMIPLKRTRNLFKRDLVANIDNLNCLVQVPGEINYMYGISFLRDVNEKEVDESVIKSIAEITRYNYEFIKLHNELFDKGKQMKKYWNIATNKTKQDVQAKTYKEELISITTLPMLKENDLVFIIADYKTPEKLTPMEKNDMFPHKRLNTIMPKIFPSPKLYTGGEAIPMLPGNMQDNIPEQLPNTHRKLYQLDFNPNNSNGMRIDKTLELIREEYIPDFVKLHYNTHSRKRK
ncbi:MAG: hypothetical protein ACLFN8_04710 [Candidatus Woesearchaeota archaeon]